MASGRARRKARRQQRRKRRQDRRDERMNRRQDRKDRRMRARDERRSTRQEGRQKKRQARISRKNAEKLQKQYGDMSPEEIEAINRIEPYKADMAAELAESGVELNDPNDPVEVGTMYAAQSDEIDIDPELSEAIDEGYVEDTDEWDDLDDAEKDGKRRGAWRKIGGFIGEVLPAAERAFGGGRKAGDSVAGAALDSAKRSYTREKKQDFFTSPVFLIGVAAVLLLAFNK